MKRITNIQIYNNLNDYPYRLRQCPPDCDPGKDQQGRLLICSDREHLRILPLTSWLKFLVGSMQGLKIEDAEQALSIIKLLKSNELSHTFDLAQDHYEWLKKVLFDDKWGQEYNSELKSAYAMNCGLELYLMMQIKETLNQAEEILEAPKLTDKVLEKSNAN